MSQHGIIWVVIFAVITMMFLHLPQMAARQDAVHNTYSALVEVDALAKQRFVEEIDGHDRLVQGAIRGVLLQLDPYSGYISPDELAAFERRAVGDYIGIGVEIGMSGRQVTVISPIDGGPADHAGIMPGDVILAIDGHQTDSASIVDVEELLVGRPGSEVQLRVRHETETEPVTLTVTRGRVSLVTVRSFRRDSEGHWDYMIDPQRGIGYIRVSNFLQTTMRDFDATCLTKVEELSPRQIKRIRTANNVSQEVFAYYLNVGSTLVSQWERGEKKPSGPSAKLLSLVKHKGLEAIA